MEARFLSGDRGTVRFRYRADKTNEQALRVAVEKVNPGFRVVTGDSDTGTDIDFRVLSRRGNFHLDRGMAKGKRTLFLFLEEEGWRSLLVETRVESLAREFGWAVRVVYLEDEAARKQFAEDFKKAGLPHLRLYDEKGTFVAAGSSPGDLRDVLR